MLRFLAPILLLAALPTSAAGDGDPFIPLTDDVFDGNGGPLLSGGIYHAITTITVPEGETLTIQGGAIVKFAATALSVAGTLDVQGTSLQPVILTSTADDTAGGDTNEDGVSFGSPGDWSTVVFDATSDASVVRHARIRFAGGGVKPGIELHGADITLIDSSVESCNRAAMHLGHDSRPTVTNCRFDDNRTSVEGVPIDAVAGFSGCTANGNSERDVMQIEDVGTTVPDLFGAATIDASNALDGDGVFFVQNGMLLHPGSSLTVGPGVTLKYANFGLMQVHGTFSAKGTAGSPVVFTSWRDDTQGGDTDLDGGATPPIPGDWAGFLFSIAADASCFEHALVRYGGGADAGIYLLDSDIRITDTRVEHSTRSGLDLSENSLPVVERCSFDSNGFFAIDGATFEGLEGMRDNTASGNAMGDYARVTDPAVTGVRELRPHNYPGDAVVMHDSLTIAPGGSLTLRPGVIVKMRAQKSVLATGSLHVDGTGSDPVIFSSLTDDEVGGDTNADGAATGPFAGEWDGIHLIEGGEASRVEHLVVRYGGLAGQAINCTDPLATMESVRVDFSFRNGIRVTKHAGDGANWVARHCGDDGILLLGGSFDVLHATVIDCGDFGIDRHPNGSWSGQVRGSIAVSCGLGNFRGHAIGDVHFSNGDPGFAGTNGNLDVDPLFVDAAAGDLRLQGGSPCIDAAELATGLAVGADHADFPRALHAGTTLAAIPDMGAFERGTVTLDVDGEPRLGTSLTLSVQGEDGIATYALGFLTGTTYLNPFGTLLVADFFSVFNIGTLPSDTPLVFALPPEPSFAGFGIGLQAFLVPTAMPQAASLSNAVFGTLFE